MRAALAGSPEPERALLRRLDGSRAHVRARSHETGALCDVANGMVLRYAGTQPCRSLRRARGRDAGAATALKAHGAIDRGAAQGAGYADRRVEERLAVANLRAASERAES